MPSAIDNGNLPAERGRERGVTNEMGREGGREDRREEAGQRQRAFKLDAHQSRTLERQETSKRPLLSYKIPRA